LYGSPSMSSARPRQLSTSAVSKMFTEVRTDRAIFQDQAVIKGVSNSPDVQMVLGHHDSFMSHISKSGHHNLCFRPTPRLITLFGKIGVRCHNPNLAKQLPRDNRSYADVVRSGMDQSGVPANPNRQGMNQRGYPTSTSQGTGQA
jgi:hypothetical protein